MKVFSILLLNLFVVQTHYAQKVILPSPPLDFPSEEEIAERSKFIKVNKIQNSEKGKYIFHSNKHFSFSCANKGKNWELEGYRWMMTTQDDFHYDSFEVPLVTLLVYDKSYYKNAIQPLESGFYYTPENWNIEKISDYYFNSDKPRPYLVKSRADAELVSKQRVKIDNIDFMHYEFKIDSYELVENKYLCIIEDSVYIIIHRKKRNDIENITKSFKRL